MYLKADGENKQRRHSESRWAMEQTVSRVVPITQGPGRAGPGATVSLSAILAMRSMAVKRNGE